MHVTFFSEVCCSFALSSPQLPSRAASQPKPKGDAARPLFSLALLASRHACSSVGFIGLGNMCARAADVLPRFVTRVCACACAQGWPNGCQPRQGRLPSARL
jgi:hypothetical protein